MYCTPNEYKVTNKEDVLYTKKYKINKKERCVVHQINTRLVRKKDVLYTKKIQD